MTQLINFEGAPLSDRFYGGQAGQKIGVRWNGRDWLLKFPSSTRRLEGSVPSYTNAPLSEYLGSHVYASLGIDVHETVLGVRDGRIVCACRDFLSDRDRLVEFAQMMNFLPEDELPSASSPSSDTTHGNRIVYLADARTALYQVPQLADTPGVVERFWDMFVTDAMIRNIDRNNTNWGVVSTAGRGGFTLAPVYDNGNSLGNKKTPQAMEKRLADPDLIRQDALDVRSCYHDDIGRPIAPFKYMRNASDPDCLAALERFMDAYDPDAFDRIIDAIPAKQLGLTVMTDTYREYQRQVMRARYEQVAEPLWAEVHTPLIRVDGLDSGHRSGMTR